jgi:hypothetical protein
MTTPENWVVIKIKQKHRTTYKVFAEWRGGYATGDSWRMNSGIKSATFDGEYYDFEGVSGSVYHCHRDNYGIRGIYACGILNNTIERWVEADAGWIEILDENTNFADVEYV